MQWFITGLETCTLLELVQINQQRNFDKVYKTEFFVE